MQKLIILLVLIILFNDITTKKNRIHKKKFHKKHRMHQVVKNVYRGNEALLVLASPADMAKWYPPTNFNQSTSMCGEPPMPPCMQQSSAPQPVANCPCKGECEPCQKPQGYKAPPPCSCNMPSFCVNCEYVQKAFRY